MKIKKKIIGNIILAIGIVWLLLTLWVEAAGPEKSFTIGKKNATKNALVVFDPDPIYDLDEQVCKGFAEGLSQYNWLVTVASVAAAQQLEAEYDLYLFCANTYKLGT